MSTKQRTAPHGAAARSAFPKRTRAASRKKKIKTVLALTAIGMFAAISFVSIYLLMLFVQVSKTLPSLADVGTFRPSEGTRIYFADGPLMAVIAMENRKPVKLDQISNFLKDAIVATEDRRYFEHKGVDYQGIARALYRNVTSGDVRGEGASTITQQLVRNIEELGVGKGKTLHRKISEAILAVKIEQSYSKQEILELYLNWIYFGNGAYGAQAAARAFFNKNAIELSVGEAAMLAGMPQRPSYYTDPDNRDAAIARRNDVLQAMVETGKLTLDDAERAKQEKLVIHRAVNKGKRVYGAPHFVDFVVKQLVHASESGAGYGPGAIYSGWKIYTTLDSRMQRAAEDALKAGVKSSSSPANQGALVAIDPKTGYIRAYAAGIDYKRDQYDIISQGKRQPGSAFKPIVYFAAFDTETASLNSTYVDSPNLPGGHNRQGWYPKNYGNKYSGGSITVLSAIKRSVNTVAVKAAIDTGIPRVIEYAHRLGISTKIEPYAPIALGANAVRPLELCSVYSVFANNGRRAIPFGVRTIIALNGDLIDQRAPEVIELDFKKEAVEMINTALREAVLHGTGTRAASVPNAHGKTGTTSDNRDAWFCGYTPELAAVVWVAKERRMKNGRLDPKTPYLEMSGATGGRLCAPIWKTFMEKALPIQQSWNKKFKAPAADNLTEDEKQKAREEAEKKKKRNEEERSRPPETPPVQSPEGTVTEGVDPNAAPPAVNPVPPGGEVTPSNPGERPETPGGAAALLPTPTRNEPPGARVSDTVSQPNLSLAGSSSAVSSGVRSSASGARIMEPVGRISTPPIPRVDPGAEIVSVRLCGESLRRATSWCDATVERRMRRKETPGRCRIHRAPPGEG